jgi:hypothetical protein
LDNPTFKMNKITKQMLVLALMGLMTVVDCKVDRDINGDINKFVFQEFFLTFWFI